MTPLDSYSSVAPEGLRPLPEKPDRGLTSTRTPAGSGRLLVVVDSVTLTGAVKIISEGVISGTSALLDHCSTEHTSGPSYVAPPL
jgi:hypothetical protein